MRQNTHEIELVRSLRATQRIEQMLNFGGPGNRLYDKPAADRRDIERRLTPRNTVSAD
jgi:hypothetical protein